MAEGDGIDIARVYDLLSQVARTVTGHSAMLEALTEASNLQGRILNGHSDTLNGHSRMLTDHSRALAEHSKALAEIVATLNRHGGMLVEHRSVLDQHTMQLHAMEGRLDRLESGQSALREAVHLYHSSTVGHGVLYSELDDRVRKLEDRAA